MVGSGPARFGGLLTGRPLPGPAHRTLQTNPRAGGEVWAWGPEAAATGVCPRVPAGGHSQRGASQGRRASTRTREHADTRTREHANTQTREHANTRTRVAGTRGALPLGPVQGSVCSEPAPPDPRWPRPPLRGAPPPPAAHEQRDAALDPPRAQGTSRAWTEPPKHGTARRGSGAGPSAWRLTAAYEEVMAPSWKVPPLLPLLRALRREKPRSVAASAQHRGVWGAFCAGRLSYFRPLLPHRPSCPGV